MKEHQRQQMSAGNYCPHFSESDSEGDPREEHMTDVFPSSIQKYCVVISDFTKHMSCFLRLFSFLPFHFSHVCFSMLLSGYHYYSNAFCRHNPTFTLCLLIRVSSSHFQSLMRFSYILEETEMKINLLRHSRINHVTFR